MIYLYITFAYSTHEMPNGAFVIQFYILVVITFTPPPPIITVFETGGGFVDDPPLFDRFAHFQIPEGMEIDLDDFVFNPDIDGILQVEPATTNVEPSFPPVVDPLPLEFIEDSGAGRSVGNVMTNRFGEPPYVVNPSTGELNYLFQFGSDDESDVTGSDPEITPEP